MNGYAGKILRIDLTQRKISTIPTAKYAKWVGGHGMGSAIFTEAHIGAYCLIHNNASVFSNVADNTEVYADGRRFPRG